MKPQDMIPDLAMPLLRSQRQKEISSLALPPHGFNVQENHSISTQVVLITYYLPIPINVTPMRVLITVIQQPLHGTILMYLRQLDCEFHKEEDFAYSFCT